MEWKLVWMIPGAHTPTRHLRYQPAGADTLRHSWSMDGVAIPVELVDRREAALTVRRLLPDGRVTVEAAQRRLDRRLDGPAIAPDPRPAATAPTPRSSG